MKLRLQKGVVTVWQEVRSLISVHGVINASNIYRFQNSSIAPSAFTFDRFGSRPIRYMIRVHHVVGYRRLMLHTGSGKARGSSSRTLVNVFFHLLFVLV